MDSGQITPQTCPECAGALIQIREGGFTRYRCHTGHAYTGDTLLFAVSEEFEQAGVTELAKEFERRARNFETHLSGIFREVAENETLSTERLKSDAHPGH